MKVDGKGWEHAHVRFDVHDPLHGVLVVNYNYPKCTICNKNLYNFEGAESSLQKYLDIFDRLVNFVFNCNEGLGKIEEDIKNDGINVESLDKTSGVKKFLEDFKKKLNDVNGRIIIDFNTAKICNIVKKWKNRNRKFRDLQKDLKGFRVTFEEINRIKYEITYNPNGDDIKEYQYNIRVDYHKCRGFSSEIKGLIPKSSNKLKELYELIENSIEHPSEHEKLKEILDKIFKEDGNADENNEYVTQLLEDKEKKLLKELKIYWKSISGIDLDVYKRSYDNYKNELYEILIDLLQTYEFSRLKHIYQQGVGHLAFFSATHTRFAHAVGTFVVAMKALDTIDVIYEHSEIKLGLFLYDWKNYSLNARYQKSLFKEWILCSLLHDIGHLPYSHILEGCKILNDATNLYDHEQNGINLLDINSYFLFFKEYVIGNSLSGGNGVIGVKEGQSLFIDQEKLKTEEHKFKNKYIFVHKVISKHGLNKKFLIYLIKGVDTERWEKERNIFETDNGNFALLPAKALRELSIDGDVDLDRIDHIGRDSFSSGFRFEFNVNAILEGIKIDVDNKEIKVLEPFEVDLINLLTERSYLITKVQNDDDIRVYEALLNQMADCAFTYSSGLFLIPLFIYDVELINILSSLSKLELGYLKSDNVHHLIDRLQMSQERFDKLYDYIVDQHDHRNEEMYKNIKGTIEKFLNTNWIPKNVEFVEKLVKSKRHDKNLFVKHKNNKYEAGSLIEKGCRAYIGYMLREKANMENEKENKLKVLFSYGFPGYREYKEIEYLLRGVDISKSTKDDHVDIRGSPKHKYEFYTEGKGEIKLDNKYSNAKQIHEEFNESPRIFVRGLNQDEFYKKIHNEIMNMNKSKAEEFYKNVKERGIF